MPKLLPRKFISPTHLANFYVDHYMIGFEGDIPYPYLDTKGIITVGRGKAIRSLSQMRQIPFDICNQQGQILRPANKKEITEGYNAFEKEKRQNRHNYKASHYQSMTQLRISKKTSKNIAINHTQLDIIQLHRHFQNKHLDFNALPPEVQIVLVDVVYNSGLGTAIKYHNGRFMQAVEKGDWSKAAEYVKELPSSHTRKTWRYNLLKEV